jgi:ketosteroid isomerase-like protein
VADPLSIIRQFYASLARGDVPAVLSLLDPKIEWTDADGMAPTRSSKVFSSLSAATGA